MARTVKTWRVLSAKPLKVGDSYRHRGDFVPEAEHWPSLRSYINAGFVEEVFVEKALIEESMRALSTRDENDELRAKAKGIKVVKKKRKVKVRRNVGNPRRLDEQSV